ncbi:MAG: type II secretion system F family protein [Parcubacteria group bacterium]|nr:type II secretion system F family protein [Parcubacteria group bacterium]
MKEGKLQNLWFRLNVQLTRKEKLIFSKYLAVLLGAGLAIDEAIKILRDQSKRSMRRILEALYESLNRGDTLSSGLSKFPHVFSPFFINLVASGEASGNLQVNLINIKNQMEKEYELNSKVRGAMIYPAVIIFAAIVISAGIFIFILPNVIGVFESLKLDLPLSTRILIFVATFVQNHGFASLMMLIAIGVCIFIIRKIKAFRPILHGMLLFTPILGGIAKKVNMARFTRSLGTMIQSGITIDEAVQITGRTLDNVHYQRMFVELDAAIRIGEDLSTVLEKHPHLVPPMASRVVHVGEQAGSLDEMLVYLAGFYEQEVSEVTENLSDLLEPILLILIGVLVGGLALSIMTPIYQVIGSF